MMQILWKYIDDLVGKGLDFFTLMEFLLYASTTLVTLSLPISILISSIMTFGKLGENFELVAIKSSGISLLRFMRPLFFVSLFFSGLAFLFANYIAPVANLKFAVIYHDIYQKSPAFDLKDGVFYNGFTGFSIKVGKKEKDKTSLHDVLIYEQSYGVQDNTIISESGKMTMSPDKKFLEFTLKNGNRYEEKANNNNYNSEFIQLHFKEYKKLFDLSQLNLQKTNDSLFMNNIRMKNMRQINTSLDSINKVPAKINANTHRSLTSYIKYTAIKDSTFQEKVASDSLTKTSTKTSKGFDAYIPSDLKNIVNDLAINSIASAKNIVDLSKNEIDNLSEEIRQYKVEWHKKLSLSVACLVMFFIGAPLGSIIRKGGLGMPLVMALIFFMVFYLLNIFGEKFTKDDILNPFFGVWLPVILLAPIGFFLTYKAMHDSQLFNKEFYFRLSKKIKNKLSFLRKK